MDIVLGCSKLNTITDLALTNTMTLIGGRIVSAARSRADGNRLSSMGTAVAIALEQYFATKLVRGRAQNG